jgi:hypothetical protein
MYKHLLEGKLKKLLSVSGKKWARIFSQSNIPASAGGKAQETSIKAKQNLPEGNREKPQSRQNLFYHENKRKISQDNLPALSGRKTGNISLDDWPPARVSIIESSHRGRLSSVVKRNRWLRRPFH